MKNKISIIVPIYGVEKYLNRCIDSILAQTYRNIEVILVDDGSLDNCGSICDEYSKKDSRIKVIHKENGGLSSARNAGLEIATGEYIGFVDSDDWIEENMYEVLINNILEYDADISVAGVSNLVENENEKIIKKNIFNEKVKTICLDKEEAIKKFFLESWSAWDKLYKREIHDKIIFPIGKINEDEAIALYLLDRCKKIVYTNKPLYNYITRANSITTSKFSKKKIDWYLNCKNNLKFIKNNYPNLEEYALYRFCNSIMWSLREISYFDNSFYDLVEILLKELRFYKNKFMDNRFISNKEKFWIKFLLLTSINNKIYLFEKINKLNKSRYKK